MAAPITTFVCNKQVITYASSKLTNGATFYVLTTIAMREILGSLAKKK